MNEKKKRILILMAMVGLAYSLCAQPKIIFDTDFGYDADDLGALAMLNQFENHDECDLLAVLSVSNERDVAAGIDAVNHFHGNPGIPIGVRKFDNWHCDWAYSKPIADKLPHDMNYEKAPHATVLYRQILSRQADKNVIIVTVGPLQNIANLLKSGPDSISPLSGYELVHQKVKEFSVMAGEFPVGKAESNIRNGAKAAAFVFDTLKLPIVFSGYEIGEKIKTGAVFNQLDSLHPLHLGFSYFSQHAPWMKHNYEGKILDNSTFDQTSVLYAVRGGTGKYWKKVKGRIQVDPETGDNTWIDDPDSKQSYLRLLYPPGKMESLIENLMLGKF